MKNTSVLVRTANGVQLIEGVTEIELIPARGMKFVAYRENGYPMRLRVEAKTRLKTQVVPIAGKLGTEE
jgi:hypothetical protein